jgi:hypothetical protein
MSDSSSNGTAQAAAANELPPIGSRWAGMAGGKACIVVGPCKGWASCGTLRGGVCYRWEASGALEWCCVRQWEQGFERIADAPADPAHADPAWEEVAPGGEWRLFLPARRLCLWAALGDDGWHWQADGMDDGEDAPARAVDDGTPGVRREEAMRAAEAWAEAHAGGAADGGEGGGA